MILNRIKNIDEIATQNSGTMQVIPTNINNPANDDVLIFNGTEWINTPKSSLKNTTKIHYLLVGGGGNGDKWGAGGAGGMITSWPSDLSGGNTSPRPSFELLPDSLITVTVGAANTSSTIVTNQPSTKWDGTQFVYDLVNATGNLTVATGLKGGASGSGHNVGGSGGGGYSAGPYKSSPKLGDDGLYQGMKGYVGNVVGVSSGGGASEDANGNISGNGLPSTLGTAAGVGDVREDGISYFAGGGGGWSGVEYSQTPLPRSRGGGGRGTQYMNNPMDQINGMANTGGGAGSGRAGSYYIYNSTGGSGICILAVETANYSGKTTGSPTIKQVTLDSKSYTLVVFLGDGSYTV